MNKQDLMNGMKRLARSKNYKNSGNGLAYDYYTRLTVAQVLQIEDSFGIRGLQEVYNLISDLYDTMVDLDLI